jgi:hypothetical protein
VWDRRATEFELSMWEQERREKLADIKFYQTLWIERKFRKFPWISADKKTLATPRLGLFFSNTEKIYVSL